MNHSACRKEFVAIESKKGPCRDEESLGRGGVAVAQPPRLQKRDSLCGSLRFRESSGILSVKGAQVEGSGCEFSHARP